MTTYTAISATETQSGKPITESLMTRFANNCLAIQEGDPTAPRIQKEAFDVGELTVIDSAYSTGGSVSFSFDHGESGAMDVYILFQGQTFLGNGVNGTATMTVDSTTYISHPLDGRSANLHCGGGRALSLGSGSHTIAASIPGIPDFIYLQAMVLKR